ncbi:MAG TPA: SRPBCC domain-containing protein [Candidatus Acidoferrum sp.]|nr:SRPBCC domain-containing protein [Candidatus Acidoferrum sp.]
MANAQSQQETKLEIKHVCPAPRERVFRAWTEAKNLGIWFHPSADHSTVISQLDLRVGGKLRVEMHHKNGEVHTLKGVFKTIRPVEKLAFTWAWEPDGVETLATLEFRDLGASTEIYLVHGNFPTIEERDKHNHGWMGCLLQLDLFLAAPRRA